MNVYRLVLRFCDFAFGAAMFAPIEFGVLFETFAPGFPALIGKFVNDVAVRIEDVGRSAKENIKNLSHAANVAGKSGRDNFSIRTLY